MAEEQEIEAFSLQKFDNEHYRSTEQHVANVEAFFLHITEEICNAAVLENYNAEKPFSFDDYPMTKRHAKEIIEKLAGRITSFISDRSHDQWLYACQKNDKFISSIMDTSKLKKARLNQMQDRNLDSLQLFEQRRINGMNLSQRVWKYVEQYRTQIELGFDVCLGKGLNAQQLSIELLQNIQNPDQLCKHIRDKRGNLYLSKYAKVFNPGQGAYRSSYKNFIRLIRSEINMAYRESEWLRWQQLDFVVGFEIMVSNRHEKWLKDVKFKGVEICDRLQGKYPKSFKFKGWHPQCLCRLVPILQDEETFGKQKSDLKGALYSAEYKKLASKDVVTDVPQGFKDWVAENMEKQANWKSTPYFVKDNFVNGSLAEGLKYFASFNSKQYTLNVKELKKRGFSITNQAYVKKMYKRNSDGFNIYELDDSLENITQKSGIKISEKHIDAFDDLVTIGYGDDEDFLLVRTFSKGIVSHDLFSISDHLQGKGLAKEIFKALYKQYKNANIIRIDTHANMDVGGYAWAKYGFNARLSEFYKIKFYIDNQLRNEKITELQHREAREWLEEYKGKHIPIYELAQKSYGKQILLDSEWSGFIDLTDEEQRKVFESYLYKVSTKKLGKAKIK